MTSDLSLVSVPGKGRGVVARRSFKRGELVFSEEPYAFVVADAYLHVACSGCGVLLVGEAALALRDQDPERFCSVECISEGYERRLAEMGLRQTVRALEIEGSQDPLRLVTRIAMLKSTEPGVGLDPPLVPLLGRFPHVMTLEASRHDNEGLPVVRQIANKMAVLFQRSNTDISPTDIEHLLLAIQCNAHRIVSQDAHPLALGLFPFTSMLNHSCEPNCAHDFILTRNKAPVLSMRAITDIEVGEEICYSYTNLYLSTKQRNEQLQSAYGFRCNCSRCEANLDGFVDQGGSQTLVKELNTCFSLLEQDTRMRSSITKRLIQILSNPAKLETFHPLHQSLFQTYSAISRAAYPSYLSENDPLFLHAVIGYGLLSVSCSYYCTQRILLDNLKVISTVSRCIRESSASTYMFDVQKSSLTEVAWASLGVLGYIFAENETIKEALHRFEELIVNSMDSTPDQRLVLEHYILKELKHYQIDGSSLS